MVQEFLLRTNLIRQSTPGVALLAHFGIWPAETHRLLSVEELSGHWLIALSIRFQRTSMVDFQQDMEH